MKMMISAFDDVRAVARSLARSPRHFVLTAGCLALGLGANAVMFGVIDALFLRPPSGVQSPERVLRVYFNRTVRTAGKIVTDLASFPLFTDIRRDAAGLRQAAAYYPTTVSEGRGSEATKLRTALVSADYFSLLGVRPQTGRLLQPADSRSGGEAVAVISDALWHRRFGGSASAIGKVLVIANRDYTIVGVAPREFTGVDLEPADLWLPLEVSASDLIFSGYLEARGALAISMLARLEDGATHAQAESDVTRAFRNSYRTMPGFDSTDHVTLAPLLRDLGPKASDQAKVSKWLGGVALAVLLIACVNCASLMLLRTVRRRREFALRAALGATRLRLAGAVLLENVSLALVGATAAVALAAVATRLLQTLLLPDATPSAALSLPRLFAFTFAIGLGAAQLSALPAIRYVSRGDLTRMLKTGARAGTERSVAQSALLVAQVALTVLLLIGTGLFVSSLRNARALDMGFRPSGVLAVSIDFSGMIARASATASSPDSSYHRFEDAIRSLPGVL
jgi:putative ABC transport system permease protein